MLQIRRLLRDRKHKAFLFLAACVAIAIAVVVLRFAPVKLDVPQPGADKPTRSSGKTVERADELISIARSTVMHARARLEESDDAPRPTASVHFPGVRISRAGMPLEGDPFVATSVEEQRWLDRNGYPNSEQLEAYSAATDAVLAASAAEGDQIAQVVLDGRRLIGGDPTAVADLWSAAVDGSGYALSTLAAYMGGSQKYGDPKSAYAISRVAEMRGDFRQALGRDFLLRKPLTPMERLEAEAEAIQLFNELVEARKRRYGPNAVLVDPRPIG